VPLIPWLTSYVKDAKDPNSDTSGVNATLGFVWECNLLWKKIPILIPPPNRLQILIPL